MGKFRKWRVTVLVIWLGLIFNSFTTYVGAQDSSSLLSKAREEIAANQMPEAIQTLRKVLQQVWTQTPLYVATSVLVKEKAQGFGLYEPRENNVYKSGEPILIYLEPAGFAIKKQGPYNVFGMAADFSIHTKDGKVLGGQKGFGRWTMKSRRFNTEFHMDLNYKIRGLKPGDYEIETTVRDLNGAGVTTVNTSVRIK